MGLLQNILLISSCLLLMALAIHTGAKFNIMGMPALFAMVVFFMVWVIGNLIEVNASTFEWMLWGRNIQQIGVFFTPLCTFYFSIEYTANRKLRVLAYIISVVQVVSVLLIFTDQYHHIMRISVELQTDTVFGHAIVVQSTTIGSILVAFNFCIPLIAVVILILFVRSVSNNLRRPLWLIIISIFATFVIATVQSTVLSDIGIIIPISVLNLPCVVLLFYAVLSGGFLGITPIALNKVFEVIDQGIIVIDYNGNVIEYNRRASELMNDLDYYDSLEIGSNILERILGEPKHPGKLYISVDDLPAELPKSQSGRYISLARHTLERSGGRFFGYVLVLTDITLLKERAELDPLTGIYNREGMTTAYSQLQKYSQSNPNVSAIIIDLDNFKNINDTYGHFGGDMILRDLVNTVQAFLEGKYVFGRHGGDEFVVLLPVEIEEAFDFAENLRKSVSERIVQYLNHKIYYTISVGIAGCNFQENSLSDLLHKADLALYKSKQLGKNTISI
ncbi:MULTISPECIES: GGDEF domain-containing protein [unclassified Sedimentibacter]|uniref:GGDEF domain-containing protein n=1 Tax=unclassified Sedimentibacter TaxID=2649220 RepID=UPI0027DEEED2|nr:diguanylate cyclase [Sedimentibacter sp. MB35-C1]WMJ76906.1 diguanylate cyclase [Sedimentibacter sp. MB35-C1]